MWPADIPPLLDYILAAIFIATAVYTYLHWKWWYAIAPLIAAMMLIADATDTLLDRMEITKLNNWGSCYTDYKSGRDLPKWCLENDGWKEYFEVKE